jgi:sterol desaturase/sphingolipid hydroxylase (fatty acid hydroxylase superfamily)/predicted lipoprotein
MMSFARVLSDALAALARPAATLLDPSARVFAPFLAFAGVIAVATLAARGVGVGRAARGIFSRDVWLHRSALADYRLIAARALLRVLFVGARGVSVLAVAAMVLGQARHHLGSPGLVGLPLLAAAVYTLGVFVAEDAGRFYLHRWMHRSPLLWEFHKVHHSAEVLTPLTLYRTHPVEGALNGAASALVVGVVMGLCAWVFGPSLRAWELLGVDALGFAWTLCGANLRHSHVWLSYGPRVERFFLSPAQHQVHHSSDPRHADRNFGTVLALWDRLGASLHVTTARRESLSFGLPAGEPGPDHTVVSLLLSPVAAVSRRLRARASEVAAAWAPSARWSPRAALLLAAMSTATCTTEGFDRTALLRSFAVCTVQTTGQFQTQADALVAATMAHAAAPTDVTRAAARAAWERAIDVWQQAEMLGFGPAGALDTLGGRGLRNNLYAWPDVNRCLIEQQLAARTYEGAGFAALSTNARGLATLEYLLYYSGADNACPAEHPLNAMGAWAAIAPDELARRRAAYAHAAAVDVAAQARALNAAWEPAGFRAQLETAGAGSTLFATQQSAFSAVAEASFHADTDMKDLRLAAPLGLPGTTVRPEALESQWADRGEQHLRNNVLGLRTLLQGCAAGNQQGFDDMLVAAGAASLATEMGADLDAIDAAINALPGDSLSRALVTDRAAVLRVHDAVKALTDFLKNEFTVTLQVSSQRVAGDND